MKKKKENFNNKNKNKTKHFVTFFFSVTHKFVEEKNNKEEKTNFFSIGDSNQKNFLTFN